jgi:hypothetical protein
VKLDRLQLTIRLMAGLHLQEALTSAPSSSDEFIVVPDHSHPVSEIVESIFNEPQAGYTTAGTFGYYLDSQVSAAGGAVDTGAIADAVWDESRAGHTTSGTFGYYLDAQVSTAGTKTVMHFRVLGSMLMGLR